MSRRPATPPIIAEPTDIDDGEHDLDWYYGEHAGGHVLSFGKHAGQKIRDTSITYLYWCNRTLDRNRYGSTICAIQAFHAGLQEYVATNYGDFRLPFGQYRGMKISECPDRYLSWANGQPHMTSKYGIFFEAVKMWLERPLEEEEGSSEPSYANDDDRKIVNTRVLDERNKAPVESPSKSHSQYAPIAYLALKIYPLPHRSRTLHVGLRIISEGKNSSDAGPQEGLDGRQPKSISEFKRRTDSEPLEHLTLLATVKLKEGHPEMGDRAPRRSTTGLKLEVAASEESLPSVAQKNEKNLESEKAQVSISEESLPSVAQKNEKNLESEKAQARARQGKNAIGTGNPFGKWFWRPSAKVT